MQKPIGHVRQMRAANFTRSVVYHSTATKMVAHPIGFLGCFGETIQPFGSMGRIMNMDSLTIVTTYRKSNALPW